MEIFDTIRAHASAMHLPLYAVSLSAVPKAGTPVLLMLHWHGFLRASAFKLAGVSLPPRPVAGSALQINASWDRMEYWDREALDAAWQLGAWDLERANHRPWWRLNAPLGEALACHRAFGAYADCGDDDATVIMEAPDQAVLMEMAAQYGYVRWLFRPRATGLWREIPQDDDTLAPGDTRPLPCPVLPRPYDRHRAGRDVYWLSYTTRFSMK